MSNKRINVTESFIPAMDSYCKYLQKAFDSKWLTNRGNLTLLLERRINKKLNLNHILLTNNGTIPLQIALKSIGGSGEIITTPFSYIATSSSIVWEQCKPIYVDIDNVYLTIDETKIEAEITTKTTAILATHVFGNPCNIEVIESIAKKHNLYVIYDAAHCFGVEYNNDSIFNYGDISTCSFHATKIFHTGEGGALFVNKINLQDELYYRHNFGHDGPLKFKGVGINAKISELQSAMGLSVLDHFDEILISRKLAVENYLYKLKNKDIQFLKIRENTKWNYSYFPIILNSEDTLLEIEKVLNENNIYPRRYFFPSLNTIKLSNNDTVSMPISESISSRILCLPLYSGITEDDIDRVCSIILKEI